jgi:NitT/TauT family transport system substrate-binding protein
VQQKPDLVKNFVAAVTESLEYASAHPDEARQILPTYTKISGDVLKNLILPSWPAEVDMASLEKLAALSAQDGLFGDEKPDLDALFS